MTRFRKRISVEDIQEIMEMMIPQQQDNSKKKDNETNTKKNDDTPSSAARGDTVGSDSQEKSDTREENKSVLLLDATCCPSDIAYPQDINLLNKGREQLEKTIIAPPIKHYYLSFTHSNYIQCEFTHRDVSYMAMFRYRSNNDLCLGGRLEKPRMHRKNARKSYLTFIRSKKEQKSRYVKQLEHNYNTLLETLAILRAWLAKAYN